MGQEGEESSPHSLSFLTLITKLQIHSAFGVRRSAKHPCRHSTENSSSHSKGSNNDQTVGDQAVRKA